MTWMMMSLRRSELARSISDHTYEKLVLNRQKEQLSSLISAIGSGSITPSEITSVGKDLFGDALDFMGYSNEAAAQIAQEQTDYYEQAYESLTQEQYYNNPAIAAQAQLYYDENGQLDTSTMYAKFYEQALIEYANECVMPILKEKEEEIENKANELETQVQLEEAEMQELKGAISSDIQNSTIKLS